MRVLVDIPDEDIEWLDRKAAEDGRSRAALVREAITHFRVEKGSHGLKRFFGLRRGRPDVGDGLEYQDRLRAEWEGAEVER